MPTVDFLPHRLKRAWQWLDRRTGDGVLPAAGVVVGNSRGLQEARLFGRQTPADDALPVRSDVIFLIASPTKPLTATAVMMLVEQGDLRLVDPVHEIVPEFAAAGKRPITVLNCLTHTSGLPDMLPENAQLRQDKAPLDEFLRRTCQLKPDFQAGHGVQYQSMGYLVLGEVVRRVSGRPLPEFLAERVFQPLEMHDTALGMPTSWEQPTGDGVSRQERIAEIRLPDDPSGHTSCWNTTYWRRLGAPWGGLLSTPQDLAKLARHLLKIHGGREGIIGPATLAAMTTNWLAQMPNVPEINRRCYPWGLGWQLNWPTHATSFGDLLSPQTYGHWGATGTLMWIDPLRDLLVVILTTEPLQTSRPLLARFSNLVTAAVDG